MALYTMIVITWILLSIASAINLIASIGTEHYDRIPAALLFVLLSVMTLAALCDNTNGQKK